MVDVWSKRQGCLTGAIEVFPFRPRIDWRSVELYRGGVASIVRVLRFKSFNAHGSMRSKEYSRCCGA